MVPNYVFHFLAISVLIVYFTSVGLDNVRVTRWEMFVPLVAHVARHVAVAIKYAYLPKPWYDRFVRVRMSIKETTSFLILGKLGWTALPEETIEREIKRAAIRCHLDLNEQVQLTRCRQFAEDAHACAQALSVNGTCPRSAKVEGPTVETMTTGDILRVIVRESRIDAHINAVTWALVPTIVAALLPTAFRIARSEPPVGRGVGEVYVVLAVFVLNVVLVGTHFNFLCVAYNDMIRRRNMFYAVGDLIAREPLSRHATAGPGMQRLIGRVDLAQPANVALWVGLHRAVSVFGLDFYYRLSALIVLAVLVAVVLVLIIFLQLLSGGVVSMHGIVLAVIFFALTLAYLLVITSLAIAANDEVGHHVVTVVRTKMFLQAAAVTGSAAGGERLSDNLELVTTLLDSAQSSLDVLERYRPLKVLGVRASNSIYSVFLSAALTIGGLTSGYVIQRYRNGQIVY